MTIQSVSPTSTTAALAARVPLESQKNAVASDVPEVVKESIAKSHEAPEAAANAEAVEEKAEVEKELQDKVGVTDTTAVATATDVPQMVKESIEKAHTDPEAAANEVAVEEKKEVEQELQQKVAPAEQSGEPAPTTETQPTVTTGVASGATTEESKPIGAVAQDNPKEKKKKNRASGFFQRLKEKLR